MSARSGAAVATAAAPAMADTEETPGEGLRLTKHAKMYYDSARL